MDNTDNTRRGHVLLNALLSRADAAIATFVPAEIRRGDTDTHRRVRLVVAYAMALAGMGIFYAAVLAWLGSVIAVLVVAVGTIAALSPLSVVRRTGSPVLAGNLLIAALFGVLAVVACRLGGFQSVSLTWLGIAPVVALSTAGRRSAAVWAGLAVLTLGAFYALDVAGHTFPHDLGPAAYGGFRLLVSVGLVLILYTLTYLYESFKNQMIGRVQESEQRFRALTENTTDITLIVGRDEKCTYASPSVETVHGRPVSEFIGQNPNEFVHPDDGPMMEEAFARAVQSPGQPVALEDFRIRHQDGSWACMEGVLTCQFDQPGVDGIVFTGRDITERRRAEEQLRLTQFAVDRASDAAMWLGPDGRFTYVNDRGHPAAGLFARTSC